MQFVRNIMVGLVVSFTLASAGAAQNSCHLLFDDPAQFKDSLLYKIFNWSLERRYEVTVKGLEEIKARGTKGTLFLLTHESYSDPLIAQKVLTPDFSPRPVMDEGQTRLPYVGKLIKWAAENVNVLLVPRIEKGKTDSSNVVDRLVNEITKALARGENIFLYPSGHIRLGEKEIIADSPSGPGKAIVHMILQKSPQTRIVLGRYSGFAGSSLGHSGLYPLKSAKGMVSRLWSALNVAAWGTFGLTPKRDINLEFWEPENFPRQGSRQEINLFMEKYFNEVDRTRRYIPYSLLQEKIHGKEIILPPLENVDLKTTEAEQRGPFQVSSENKSKADAIIIETLDKVLGEGVVKKENLKPKDKLIELGVDSLRYMELTMELEAAFGIKIDNPLLLQTVEDVYWCAEGNNLIEAAKVKASRVWTQNFKADEETRPLNFPKGESLLEMTVKQSANNPHRIIGEDAQTGALSNRMRLLKASTLASVFKRQIHDEYVGLMMPPSAGGRTLRLSLMRAGKIPAMVNYTDGIEGIKNAMDLVGATKIVTSKTFVERIKSMDKNKIGLDPLTDRFIFVEDLIPLISMSDKIWGAAEALIYSGVRSFKSTAKYVAILFTSGSTAAPKGVSVTDKMVRAVIKLLRDNLPLTNKDSILAVAPTFHSLGFALEAASDVLGIPLYHFPDPRNGTGMAKVVSAYKTTFFVGTPDFIMNLYKSGTPEQLNSLRYIISGAAKLTQDVVDIVKEKTPDAVIVEGYGVTEAVPLIAINPYQKPKRGSVGKMVVDYVIANPDTFEPVSGPNQEGVLLVKGENIMDGYFHQTDEQNPFVDAKRNAGSKELERWYNTGDMVKVDEDGYVFIVGRLGRFRKKGGEKIALPRVEEALENWVAGKAHESTAEIKGPLFVVESAADDSPFVLFTAFPLGTNQAEILNQVNSELARKGLPSSHNIQEIRYLPEGIPMLGSGKPKPKALQELLKKEKSPPKS